LLKITTTLENLRPEEERILLAIARLRRPGLTLFLKVVTYSGVGAAYFSLAILLFVLNRLSIELIPQQRLFLNCMLAALLSWVISRQLKKAVARNRPNAAGALIPIPPCESFPSGHAAASIALFTALVSAGHPAAPVVGVWATLVCFSRPYLGVHFLSDVGAGILVGSACGFVGGLFS
jgi:undecaprenyl-diphosphatase